MSSTIANDNVNFFAGFYEWDINKIVHLTFQMVLNIFAPVLLYLVIAYENSLNNRLLTNLLLSHCCCINFIWFFTARICYLIFFYFGPFSSSFCSFTAHSGRFFVLLALGQLALWQLVKLHQRFRPRYMLIINDDFFALFLTSLNFFFNAIHSIVALMRGMHNSELDYHLCTGRKPADNINEGNSSYLKFRDHQNNYSETFTKETYIGYFIFILIGAILVSAVVVWLYSKKEINNIHAFGDHSDETMLGAGGSLILILLVVALTIPLHITSEYGRIDPESINSGHGKAWLCFSRLTLALLSFCIVPVTIISSNPRLRRFAFDKLNNLSPKIQSGTEFIQKQGHMYTITIA